MTVSWEVIDAAWLLICIPISDSDAVSLSSMSVGCMDVYQETLTIFIPPLSKRDRRRFCTVCVVENYPVTVLLEFECMDLMGLTRIFSS